MPEPDYELRHRVFSEHYRRMAAERAREAAPAVLSIGEELDQAVADFVMAVSKAFSKIDEGDEMVRELRKHGTTLLREGAPTLGTLCQRAANRLAVLQAGVDGEALRLLKAVMADLASAEDPSEVVGRYVSSEHYNRALAFLGVVEDRE